MKVQAFSIRDKKAEVYDFPFPAQNAAVACRMVESMMRQGNTPMAQFPDDYVLVHVGEFDQDFGVINACDHAIIAELSSFAPNE